MKRKMLRLMVFCMFVGLVSGFLLPTASAQGEADQNPVLTVKVRDINRLISDIQKLVPPTPGSKAGQQIAMIPMMLQGTDWIDSGRSIVAGMVLEGQKASWVAMIPFSVENAAFQKNFNAIAGNDYYMLALPPQPGASISPAVENSLIDASKSPAASNLEFEAGVGKLVDIFEPQLAALSKKIETSPEAKSGAPEMSLPQIESILKSTMESLRQIDIFRLGLDLSGDIFTLHFDIDASPNSELAGILVDKGGDMRLTNYQFDMPIQYRSRAHNMAGMMDLMESTLGSFYSQLGIDFDDMTEIVKVFTGEMAGGMRISSDGFAMEMVAVLQPGTDGEDFVQNTYMPWFERYNKQISDLMAKDTGKPGVSLYGRTADSVVDGIKVAGINMNLSAVIPPDQQKDNPFANQSFEMRLAGAGDLIFIASNDTEMAELIAKSRNLTRAPAQGPTIRFDIDLGAFFKDIQSMIPPEKLTTPLPVDLGKVTMQAEMRNGELTTQASFNIAEIQKLIAAAASAAAKAKTDASGNGQNPQVN
jgi:hypothetical protein